MYSACCRLEDYLCRDAAAMAAGPKNVDPKVVRVNFDIGFLGFRQNGHGNGAGVYAPLRFSGWYTLNPMYP